MTGRTVLLIEDEPDIRLTIKLALEMSGYQVPEATSGEQALDLLHNGIDPDAILLDIRLPGMDGLDVLRVIRETEHLRPVPVIVLSAHAGSTLISEAQDLGCDAYLTKPFSMESLRSALTSVLADRP